MNKQLKMINNKLSNVLTKDDPNLKTMIKEIIQQMKEELIAYVSRKIEVLEGRLFDKEEENENLKSDIETLNKQIEEQNEEYKTLKRATEKSKNKTDETINNLEQYGRRNNLRIYGIQENNTEDAETTADVVVQTLNNKIENLNLAKQQIDISHRMGKQTNANGKHRQIIVKFVSRMTREKIMSRKKQLKGTNIFIGEDLTRLNNRVLTSIHKNKNKNDIKKNKKWNYIF